MSDSTPVVSAAPVRRGLEYKWKVLISVIFGVFMIILDTTVVNIAFQTLRREYGAALNDAQWILSVYVLLLGITTPLSGFLADRFGLKRVYIIGLAVFGLGSALCGLSPSLGFLILARAIQGFGGGLAQPLGPALLFRAFPPKEQGSALGFFGIAIVIAPALGPILGGWLVDLGLWRWIFFINVPIGLLGVTLAARWLVHSESGRQPRLDPFGLVTAVVGFGAVLYAATRAADEGWTSPSVLVWFGIGAAALVAFAWIELFLAKEPLLDLRLFKSPTFLTANLLGYVTVIALFGAEFLMPVYLQALRGRTALETGLILLALAVTAGVAIPVAGRLYDRIGPRPLVVIGLGILLINTWQFSQIQADTPIPLIMFLLALRGVALGLTVQTTFASALSKVPLLQLARGSSLLNSTRFVVQSIGVAILATVLTSTLSPETKAASAQAQAAAPTAVAAPFGVCETPGVAAEDNLPEAARAQLASLDGAQAMAIRARIRAGIQQACAENLLGFEHAYRLTFYATLVALVVALFLPGWPAAWVGRGAQPPGQGAPASAGH